MIRPIDNLCRIANDKRTGPLLITLIFISVVVVVVLRHCKRKAINPDVLYQIALNSNEQKIFFLEEAAKYHHPQAKLELASLYTVGKGVPQDLNRALLLLENLNTAESIFKEGLAYSLKGDYLKALQKFVIASIRGHVPSYHCAALAFFNGKGTSINLDLGLAYLEKGITENDPNCMLIFAQKSFRGMNISVANMKRAIKLCLTAAKLNSLDACSEIAMIYLMGLTDTLVENEVKERLEYAVNKGSENAIYILGIQKLRGGNLYKADPEEGIKLLKKIEKSHLANYEIGHSYEKGKGVEHDLEQAKLWYSKGAENGNAQCCYKLYKLNRRIEDLDRAVALYHRKATLQRAVIALREKDMVLSYNLLKTLIMVRDFKAAQIFGSIMCNSHFEDPSVQEIVIHTLELASFKFPKSFYHLYLFLEHHDKPELALEALEKGAERCDLSSMKALYQIKRTTGKHEEADRLFDRIKAREPEFTSGENTDVEISDM